MYPPNPDDPDDLVPCITVGDVSLLPHIKAILDAGRVPHFVKNEGVQHVIGWGTALFGFNPITGAPVVMVAASDLDRAKALLEEIAVPSPTIERAPRHSVCGHCGGALDGDAGDAAISHCYHCGWPLPSA